MAFKGETAKIGGNFHFPVVLGYFSDYPRTYIKERFDTLLFSNAFGVKSVCNYYRDMSYGAMSCSGRIAEWVSCGRTFLDMSGSQYGFRPGTSDNIYEFIHNVLESCDGNTDFADSSYDLNQDGFIDVLWVVHAGRGGEEAGSLWFWSHSGQLSDWGGGATYYTTNDISPYTGDYVRINRYIIMPELTNYSGSGNNSLIGCGVFCHEFGHALGLPDLYDTGSNQYISGYGLGVFSLMAAGSWGGNYVTNATPTCLDVWSKRYLGWLTPTAIGDPGTYTISSTLETPTSSSYMTDMFGVDSSKQYWLMENRYKLARGPSSGVAWDSFMLAQGLAMYHIDSLYIDTSRLYFRENKVNCNSTNDIYPDRPYGVALEETDDSTLGFSSELWEGTSYGDSLDLWSEYTQRIFDVEGNDYPTSYLNDGITPTTVVVNDISAPGLTMSFRTIRDFSVGIFQNPAFPQFITLTAVSSNTLLHPTVLDTALVRIPGINTDYLVMVQIGVSHSYQADYEIRHTGSHIIHLAAQDSACRWRRAERIFNVVAGKANGGVLYINDQMRLELSAGALARDMYFIVVPSKADIDPCMACIFPAMQVGPDNYPLERSCQLVATYEPMKLNSRDPYKLGIYHLEEGEWHYIGGVLDEQGHQVIAHIDKLGTYLLAWNSTNASLDILTTRVSSFAVPNPFTKAAEIRYQLARKGPVKLTVYNSVGQLVRVLTESVQDAGFHLVVWDGRDGMGRQVASGVYLYMLKSESNSSQGKIVKLK